MGGKNYNKKNKEKNPQDGSSNTNPNPNPNQGQRQNPQLRPNQQQQQQQQQPRPNQPQKQQRSGQSQQPQSQFQSSEQQSKPGSSQGAWGQQAATQPQQTAKQHPKKPQQKQEQPQEPNHGQLKKSEFSQSTASISSQKSDASKQSGKSQVPTKMKHLMCAYKGPGKAGRKLGELETNYLKIILDKMNDKAYHYDVQIEPERPKKYLAKAFQEFCKTNFTNINIAFDGVRNAFSPVILPLDNIQRKINFRHPETGGTREYVVNIKPTDDFEIPLNSLRGYTETRQFDMPRRALQCLEIILKGAYQQAHLNKGIQTGRSFFMPPDQRQNLGDFFELWLGLFQSTVLGSSPYLNVDVAHKAFPIRYESLADLLYEIEQEYRTKGNDAIMRLEKHLKGLDIMYTQPGNAGVKKIHKFLKFGQTPDREMFEFDGKTISVAKYFKDRNFSIKNSKLPCVKLGNSIRNISVPMEHCSLSDRQAINKKCTEEQTRNMIKIAATSTDVRKAKIVNLLNQIRHNSSPILRDFGLSLNMNFLKVMARQLNAPTICYNNGKTARVSNGVWRGESMPFLVAESANKWAILNCNQRTRRNELEELAGMLFRVSRPTNLNLAERPNYIANVSDRDSKQIVGEMTNAKANGIRILFCIIPDSGPTYGRIKQIAEIQIGVLTQCIKGGTVFRKRNDGSTISNILLKVNAKLNGTNHCLNDSPILKDNCMIIGADVTHPSPDQQLIPSVVGVAASHDRNAFCYNACWRLQGPREEIIKDFKEIISEHLKFYKEKNKRLPDKILYYRDGVSEGQFQQVMGTEKIAMEQACASVEKDYEKRVKLTIIVVQKRHHTRFFPGKSGIGQNDRRNNNVPAGTIVDTEIVHPQENHFYLETHQSIQGVARPTKYCILLDDGNHKIDDLQGLSYNLCHLFSRCNRSVSYPAPTYYAHLAAARGRVYIENDRMNMENLQREWRNRTIKESIIKGHPMFFV